MSVVKLLYTDATCPKCGIVLSDINSWCLPHGDLIEGYLDEDEGTCWCDCGVEPVYEDVPSYQAVCDRCGLRVEDYGWWDGAPIRSMGPTPGEMWECLPDWQHLDGRDLCEDCWWVSDDDDKIVERPPLTEKEDTE